MDYNASIEKAFDDALARLGPDWEIVDEAVTGEYIIRIGRSGGARQPGAGRASVYQGTGVDRVEAMRHIMDQLDRQSPKR